MDETEFWKRGLSLRPILRGVTMIELVVVLFILALMAGVAVPRFANSVARRRVEAAANRIVADMALAQREARLTSAGQYVTFNIATSTYRLLGRRALDRGGTYTVDLTAAPYEIRLTQAVFGGDAQVIFDGYGNPDSGGTVQIAAGGCTATITFDGASGKATVAY